MPAVGRIVEELYGRAPVAAADVDRVVALGAAVQAGLVARHGAVHERLVNDVLTHSLGVRVAHTVDGRLFHDRFSPVLSRGTVLPATRSEVFSTVEPRQTRVVLEVYEGEHRTVVENTFLGRLEVGELPPAPGPQPIDVRFAHDASGLLEIEATVHATGRRSRLVLERSGVRFTPEARAAAERDLAALAVHPKEEAGNRLSVERAIRLVELLAGPRRAALDDLVLAVEVALDRRDPAAIAFARDRLDGAVASIVAELGLDLS